MIRHGERTDCSNLPEERARIENIYDCPLTYLGVSQAHITGQYLKQYLARGNYQRIILESSPLLRTLETATAIAKELGVQEININYHVFEWLSEDIFPEGCPVDNTIFVKTKS